MSQPEDAKAAPAPPAAGQELVLEPIAPAVVPAPAVPAPARKPQDQPGHPGTAVDPLIVPQSAQFGCLPLEPYALPNPDGDPNYFAKKAGELQVQPNQPDPATVEMHDVLVVGGGLSGLTCAFRVLDSAAHELGLKGNELPKVAVLESAAKLGGRTRSSDPHLWDIKDKIDANAGHISYGGTWVMFDNHELLSLSWDLDHLPFQPKLFPNFTTYALNWRLLVLHPYLIIKLRTLGSRIYNAKDPNSAEFQELKKLDTIPVEQWLAENAKGLPFPDHAKQAVRDWCYQGENFPTQPEHLWFMSTWFLARMIYVRLSHFAQTGTIFSKVMRWENGTGEVVDRLAKKIRDLGGYCYTEQRVDSCVTKGDHVEVTVTRREGDVQKQAVYRARRVVMAGAPHASTRITYEPPLPQNYIDFGDSMRLWDDVGTQVVLVWSTRWWDKKWKSAVMLPPPDDEQQGVYGACMDLSDHGPAAVHNYLDVNKHPLPTGIGVLRILVKSSRLKNPDGSMWDTDRVRDSAFAYLIKEGRLAKNLEEMGKGFLKCWVWNHEWNPDTLGTAFFAPPTLNARYASSVPACDKPWGHFHFAGSERARRGTQWMDGAVYAGQHKAPEVLESLYPGRYRHNQERQAYKARILKSEEQAIALLRKTLPHHKFLYFFEMVLRWAAGNIANIWHNLVELSHEHWKDLAPKLPDGAKFELFTQASAEHGAVLREGDHLFSHNGRFRLGLTDHGTVILLHMRLNEAPGEVWQSDKPEHKKLSPYKLVLQPDGDLQLFSDNPHHASDTFVWHSHSACPKGLYASFRLLLGDDRGLNVYGYYPNGSRQIIWSAHTSDIHFSRPTLRQESIDRHDQLVHLHATLHKSKPVGFRRPEPGEEQRILDDMFKQQVKEKSYGQLMCHAVVDVEHRRSHKMEMHFMTEGQELREGQGLLSPHESHRIHVENGDLVITHKKTHGFHPISPWEEVPKWRAGVTGKNARLVLTHEGQLQLFHGPTLAWSSPKPAKPRSPFQFHIHDDCNAALYNSRVKPVWSTETACAPDVPFGEGEQDE